MNLETLIVPLQLEKSGFESGIGEALKGLAKFAAAAGAIIAVTATIKKAVDATFEWANELDSLGDIIGGTNEELAALNFVARKSGVGAESLTKSMTMLNKGMLNADGTLGSVGKNLKEFGINVFDSNKNIKDQSVLFDEVSKKYGTFSTQQERVNFLTKVFGRNGAEMVDFFDTLAQEGGIDAVTKKVQALGLVIDPGRYEQFTRNIEEFKMAFLGLAITLTEALMPVFEKIVNFMTTKLAPALGKISKAFKTGGFKGGMAEINSQLTTLFDGLDWTGAGDTIGKGIESAFLAGIAWVNGGGTGKLPSSIQSLVDGVSSFFTAAVGGKQNVEVWKKFFSIEGMSQLLPVWNQQIQNNIAIMLNNMNAAIKSGLGKAWNAFYVWGTRDVPAALSSWASRTSGTISAAMVGLYVNVSNWLREIAKEFFLRALAWTQQMISGFNSGKSGLLASIRGLVNEINGILNKIISTFTVNGKIGNISGGTVGTKTNTGGIGTRDRATGGPVIAGQTYRINERGHELFTPAVNGYVSPMSTTEVTLSRQSIYELAQQIGIVIPTATVKAMNSV